MKVLRGRCPKARVEKEQWQQENTASKPGQLFGANSIEVSVIMKNGSNISAKDVFPLNVAAIIIF